MNTEEIMKLADAYAMPNGGVRTYEERDKARAALEAALTAKQGEQERPTFDEWTSAHTRANLQKLKPEAKQEPNYELLRLLETAEQDLQAVEQRQHSNPEMLAVHIRANLRKAIDLCVIDVAKVGFRQALAHPAPSVNAQERDPFIEAAAKLNAELMAKNFQKDERITKLEAKNAQLLDKLKGAANYIDKLGGVSRSYRQAIAAVQSNASTHSLNSANSLEVDK